MGLSIKNAATEQRARTLAALTGETLTTAIDRALEERLERVQAERAGELDELQAVIDAFRDLPILDARPSEALFDELYDEDGLPR